MKPIDFQIEDEFQNPKLEREVLGYLQGQNGQAKTLATKLRSELFPNYPDALNEILTGTGTSLRGLIEPPREDFDFRAAVRELEELDHKRHLARMQQEAANQLFAGASPETILRALEQNVLVLRRNLTSGEATVRRYSLGLDLAGEVLDYARRRQQQRMATGKPVSGILTGISALDRSLNGLNAGLHILAAGPGAGKTTFALQVAWAAVQQGKRVAYVTYENSMSNLMLKLLCAQCGLSPAEIERGYGDVDKLEIPLLQSADVLERLVLYEGHPEFSFGHIEADLLIFDYLQRAAHGAGYEQLRHNVSAMTGQLRDWAMQRNAAVLAISSLNRSASDYGRGGGVQLENLKESGDLEYGADTVMLLYPPTDTSATPPARDLELRIAKNRFGPLATLRLVFRPDTGVFRERL